jgi:hypothetical protein
VKMSAVYDRAEGTAHDWADHLRDEITDLSPADLVTDAGERAAEWVGDTAGRLAARLPSKAAARRSKRRRWIGAGVALAVALYLFGPGGSERRAALRDRFARSSSDTAQS